MTIHLQTADRGVTFEIRVQPRASRTEITGSIEGAIKLKVAAPPTDGKANEECCRFFAKLFGIPRSSVQVVKGATSRSKVIRIYNSDPERVKQVLGD